jgi:hypothetical protein
MYDFSAANNELGNPVRDLVQGTPGNSPTDGGVILPGVAPDGTTNTELMLTYMQMHGVARALINYTFMTLDISNCVKRV